MKEKTADIDILEEYFNRICFDETNKITADLCTIGIDEIRAIENLMAENKELKKEVALNTEIHKRDEIIKDLKETIACLHETDDENFIPKSKVEEKIKAILDLHYNEDLKMYVVSVLQSLLGKE